MTRTIHITGITDHPADLFRAIRAIRSVTKILTGEDCGLPAARSLAEQAAAYGAVFVGESEDHEAIAAAIECIGVAGFDALLDQTEAHLAARRAAGGDPSPEQVFAAASPGLTPDAAADACGLPQAGEPEEVPVFSNVAYETAIALVAMTDGNPIKACAHARTLANTTQDTPLYAEVILALGWTFRPWLPELIEQAGLRIDA